MKKLYTEVLIPRVKNWGSENRWEKLGPQDVKNTPVPRGKSLDDPAKRGDQENCPSDGDMEAGHTAHDHRSDLRLAGR